MISWYNTAHTADIPHGKSFIYMYLATISYEHHTAQGATGGGFY